MQDLSARQGQRNEDQHDRHTRHDRAAQHLINGRVDRRFFTLTAARLQILSNPVKDDDRVRQ